MRSMRTMSGERPLYQSILLSDFNPLCQIERLALINSQIVRRAADALVAQQVLAGRKVLRLVIDCRRFRPAHRVCAVPPGIYAGKRRPFLDQVGILFAGQMTAGFAIADTGPQERFRVFVFVRCQQPVGNRIPSLRRQRHDVAGTGLFLADRKFMDDIAVVIRDIDDS